MLAFTEYRALFDGPSILPAFIVPAAVLALPIAGLILYWWRRRRRSPVVAAAARKLSFRFRPGSDPRARDRFPQFGPRQLRLARDGYNTATGVLTVFGRAAAAYLGDCVHVVRGVGDEAMSANPKEFSSYIAIRLPLPGIPDLLVRRDRIDGAGPESFGLEHIDFESVEFNKRFDIYSASKRFGVDLFEPLMIEFLLESGAPPLSIEDGWLMITGGSKTGPWKAHDFEAAHDWALAFLSRWPDHLLAEFTGLAERKLPGKPRYLS